MTTPDWLHLVSKRTCCWEEDDARPPDGERPREAALRLFRLPYAEKADETYDGGDSVFLRFGALVVCESPLGGSIHVLCRRGAERGWEPERVFGDGPSTTRNPDHIGYGHEVTIYGLWHDGWCNFHSGSVEEAELGRQQFIRDGQDPADYVVAVFDPERDPIAIEGLPTPAQLDMLEYVERARTINRWPMPKNWRATAAVLSRNGWFTSNVGPDGQEVPRRPMRLTPAGLRALRAGREKSSQE